MLILQPNKENRMLDTMKNLVWAIGNPAKINNLKQLDKTIDQACSIDRTNGVHDCGYSIEATPKGRYVKIATGKRIRYISLDNCGFYIYNNELL